MFYGGGDVLFCWRDICIRTVPDSNMSFLTYFLHWIQLVSLMTSQDRRVDWLFYAQHYPCLSLSTCLPSFLSFPVRLLSLGLSKTEIPLPIDFKLTTLVQMEYIINCTFSSYILEISRLAKNLFWYRPKCTDKKNGAQLNNCKCLI